MPELPEVETIKRDLEKNIIGLNISEVILLMPKIVRTPSPQDFIKNLTGKTIKKIERRGKYILIHLSEKLTLLIHLRMTGNLVYCSPKTPCSKYTHVIFELSNGYKLFFSDMRQFGRMVLINSHELCSLPGFKDLGVEPLSDTFTRDLLKKELKGRRIKLKPLLLDQTFIAGLGNIYADEALHMAKISPDKLASMLTHREIAHLYEAIREVLSNGIANRGTTFRDYKDGMGEKGSNQDKLKVYSREGKPCFNCGKPIIRIKLSGRSSYLCAECQK